MVKLSKEDRSYLREALTSSYQSYPTLRSFVIDNFGLNLNIIAPSQALKDAVDALIVEFDQGSTIGDISVLIWALYQDRPNNSEVKTLMQRLQGRIEPLKQPDLSTLGNKARNGNWTIEDHDRGSSDAVVKEAPDAELVEPINSAHLVLAAFWEGEKSLKTLRVSPKLCYRKPENPSKIYQEAITTREGRDEYSIPIEKFPDRLKRLHTFSLINKLKNYSNSPWKLSIRLFLPTDLLCLPLTTWCGQDGEFVSRHSVVIGCSDRFNPSCPEESFLLRNQLELQWERFLNKVPDKVGSTLRDLDWLNSEDVGKKGWIAHAGFRCFGDWLTPGDWRKLDESEQKKWQDLINYGLPIALWMCEGQPTRAQRQDIFNRLICGTRFDLLDYLPQVRDVQRKSGECVGVLYEDLNYMPDLPQVPGQEFLDWPD